VEFANGVRIGGDQVVSWRALLVESKEQLFTVAEQVAKAAPCAAGGAFKPDRLLISFQGWRRGFELLRKPAIISTCW